MSLKRLYMKNNINNFFKNISLYHVKGQKCSFSLIYLEVIQGSTLFCYPGGPEGRRDPRDKGY